MRMRDLINVVEAAEKPPDISKMRNGRSLHDTPLERARQKARETFRTPDHEKAMQLVRDIIAYNETKRRQDSR
jgi:hypothetical protein